MRPQTRQFLEACTAKTGRQWRQEGADKWVTCCPAHDDRHPSLGVWEGEKGVMFKCRSQSCDKNSVISVVGLSWTSLFWESKANGQMHGRPRKGRESIDGAIRSYLEYLPKKPSMADTTDHHVTAVYPYSDSLSTIRIEYVREGERCKDVIPFSKDSKTEQWQAKRPEGKLPLYNLSCLKNLDPGARVLYVEGEKTVERLKSVGIPAICNLGSQGGIKHTDFSPLKNFEVPVVPDNDIKGLAVAQDVLKNLHSQKTRLAFIAEFPGLPPKGDLADVVDQRGSSTAEELQEWINREIDRHLPTAIHVEDFDGVTPLPTSWAVQDRVQNGFNLFLGDGDVGKGLTLMDLVSRFTRGDSWPDSTVRMQTGMVMWCGFEEDGRRKLLPRLLAAGGDPKRFRYVHLVKTPDGKRSNLDLTKHLAELRLAIRKLHPCFIVLDPLQDFFPGVDFNSVECRRALLPLVELLQECDTACAAILHLNKQECRSLKDKGMGSKGIFNLARIAWAVIQEDENDPNSPRYFGCIKNNDAKKPPTHRLVIEGRPVLGLPDPVGGVVWHGTTDTHILQIWADAQKQAQGRPERQTKLQKACAFIPVIRACGVTQTTRIVEVLETLDIHERTAYRAIDELSRQRGVDSKEKTQ